MEYRDAIKSKIGMPCTHSTVIKTHVISRINDTSPILSQRHTAEGSGVRNTYALCSEVSVSELNRSNH